MEQTREERDALLDQAKDGMIFCLDLDDVEGQHALGMLKERSPDIAKAAQFRDLEDQLRYMLALLPYSAGGRAVVRLATEATLSEAIEQTWARANDFGSRFAAIVVPPTDNIYAMFAKLHVTVGTA